MGCSASVPNKVHAKPEHQGPKVVHDEEDYDLFPIILDPTGVPEFDTVFEQLEAILAQFITWSNAINDYAIAVQNLLAPGLGAIVPDIQIAKNVDMLTLDLITPFNKQRAAPQHHVLLEWVKNKEVRDADEALAQARLSLMQFLAHSGMQVHLKLMDAPPGHIALNILQADVPESDQERVLAINAGVEQLQKAVGPNFGVLLKLMPGAAKLRGKTVLALLCKRQTRDAPDDAPGNLVPATMVDIFNCGMTEAILKADRSVVIIANELAKLSQQYDPPLAVQEEPRGVRKLRMLPVAREYEEVNHTIRNLNAVLFKLAKACAKSAWIHSTPLSMPEVDFPDLPFMICEALKRVADATWTICKKQLDSIHLVTLLTHHVSACPRAALRCVAVLAGSVPRPSRGGGGTQRPGMHAERQRCSMRTCHMHAQQMPPPRCHQKRDAAQFRLNVLRSCQRCTS